MDETFSELNDLTNQIQSDTIGAMDSYKNP